MIPIPGLSWLRLAVAGVVLAAVAASHWKTYSMGKRAVQGAWDAQIAAQVIAASDAAKMNAATSIRRVDAALEAQNAATRERQNQNVLRDRVAVAERGLRDTIAASGGAPAAGACNASGERTAAVAELFAECRGALASLAGKADGHATDSLMYQNAWPR